MAKATTRAEIMGITRQPVEKYKEFMRHYMDNVANVDDRRLMWLIEAATEAIGEEISSIEKELMIAERFNHTSRVTHLTGSLSKYEEDFKFLYSALQLIKNKNAEQWAKDMSSFLKKDRSSGKRSK